MKFDGPTDEEFEQVKRACTHLCTGPFVGVVVIIDGTEVRCQRSRNYETQQQFYSGKKKMHTLQWQVTVLPTGHIIDFSQMFHGRPNDKAKYDSSNLREKFIGKPYALMGDSGYQGINELEWATRPRGKQWCPPAPKEIVSGIVPHKRKRKQLKKGKKCFSHLKRWWILKGQICHFSYPKNQLFIQKAV
jgi:hypothetical protein